VNLFCNAFRDCGGLAGPFLSALSWNTFKSAKKAAERPTIVSAVVLKPERLANFSPGNRNSRLPPPRKGCPGRERLDVKFLVPTRLPACSHAVEDFESPQHDDNGRYQRGHRQYTF